MINEAKDNTTRIVHGTIKMQVRNATIIHTILRILMELFTEIVGHSMKIVRMKISIEYSNGLQYPEIGNNEVKIDRFLFDHATDFKYVKDPTKYALGMLLKAHLYELMDKDNIKEFILKFLKLYNATDYPKLNITTEDLTEEPQLLNDYLQTAVIGVKLNSVVHGQWQLVYHSVLQFIDDD